MLVIFDDVPVDFAIQNQQGVTGMLRSEQASYVKSVKRLITAKKFIYEIIS